MIVGVWVSLIKSIDDVVGRVMNKLREYELERNTLILFASDNGAPNKMGRNEPGYPEDLQHEGRVWNGSNNVPMRGEKGSLFEEEYECQCLLTGRAGYLQVRH